MNDLYGKNLQVVVEYYNERLSEPLQIIYEQGAGNMSSMTDAIIHFQLSGQTLQEGEPEPSPPPSPPPEPPDEGPDVFITKGFPRPPEPRPPEEE